VQDNLAPFMEKIAYVRENKCAEIPAVTHIDGTGRLHTVDKENGAGTATGCSWRMKAGRGGTNSE